MKSLIILSLIILGLFLSVWWLIGSSDVFNPVMSKNIDDDRDSSESTIIFKEYRSTVYLLKYNGQQFLVNSQGGIVILDRDLTSQ